MWFTYHSKLLGVPRPPLDASRYLKVLWTASEREEILRFKTAGFWPLSAFVGDLGLMLIAVNVMFHVCQAVFWTLADSGKYLPKDWPEGVGWTWPQQYLSNESSILVNLASHDLFLKGEQLENSSSFHIKLQSTTDQVASQHCGEGKDGAAHKVYNKNPPERQQLQRFRIWLLWGGQKLRKGEHNRRVHGYENLKFRRLR